MVEEIKGPRTETPEAMRKRKTEQREKIAAEAKAKAKVATK
jgi:hypothetical protein